MGKGRKAVEGTETWNQNGYCQVKTSTGWRFKHHLIAEGKLGRPLADNERVIFIDGDRKNLDPENLQVVIKQVRVSQTYDKRLTALGDRMQLFVEEAPRADNALDDLLQALNDVRLSHGFSAIISR